MSTTDTILGALRAKLATASALTVQLAEGSDGVFVGWATPTLADNQFPCVCLNEVAGAGLHVDRGPLSSLSLAVQLDVWGFDDGALPAIEGAVRDALEAGAIVAEGWRIGAVYLDPGTPLADPESTRLHRRLCALLVTATRRAA